MSDRDRRLAEAMGEAYHGKLCSMCYPGHCEHDFDNDGKKRLMDWAVEQEWWKPLLRWVELSYPNFVEHDGELFRYLWRNLPSLLVEYHGEER